jgi:anthranilate phosphoribosyltransferase
VITDAIKKLTRGEHLSEAEAHSTMFEIMSGEATPSQIAAVLIALSMKKETPDEIAGFARAMREKSITISPKVDHLVDTCGTGGDRLNTFNVSTIAAFVAAGAGAAVAKHGNRAMTSRCGSADLLEALGVKIDLEPAKVQECIEKIGIGFLFAPLHHPAMKYAGPTRKEIGVRTAFNVLGPLTNPAGAANQVIGVFDPDLLELVVSVLKRLGSKRVFAVHGSDGLDELSNIGETLICELRGGEISTWRLEPESLGLERARADDIAGGSVEENAEAARRVLSGEKGPRRGIVAANAALAIAAAGLAEDIERAMPIACESIDSGSARRKLEELVLFSRMA